MKKTRILAFLLIGIVIITFFGLQDYKPRIKTFSNVTELYSLFTPYAENYIKYRLQVINCQPNNYYYNNSSVCFFCDEIGYCFGYAWVNRTGGEKMNFKGLPFLDGKYSQENVLNFYSFGISSLLNCECDIECVCEDEIKPRLENDLVVFTFPENLNIEAKIKNVVEKAGIDECEFTSHDISEMEELIKKSNITGYKFVNTNFLCEDIGGIIRGDEVIFGLRWLL